MDVGVIGLGLIGGSIALNLSPGISVIGFDTNPRSVQLALERKAIEHVASSYADFLDAKVIFIATPPATILSVLRNLEGALREDAVVTDCAGTKAEIIKGVEELSPQMQNCFVGGHPMAGKEKGGMAEAQLSLFEGASWILTPTEKTSRRACDMVAGTVASFGANAVEMSAELHDQRVAILSHLPHVIAGALVKIARPIAVQNLSAGSWSDLTRVAGADPELWTQILFSNRKPIIDSIRELSTELVHVERAILDGDEEAIRRFFHEAVMAKQIQQIHEP